MSITKIVAVLFLAGTCYAFPREFDYELPPRVGVFEDIIKKSIECVRGVLHDGIPDLDFPPLDPMRFNSFPIDFNLLNLSSIIKGRIDNTNVSMDRVSAWNMTSIKGKMKLIPPTYAVNFTMHYDSIVGKSAHYKGNISALGLLNLFGEGKVDLEFQNVTVNGYVKAVIDGTGVHIKNFEAPITLGKAIINITGIEGDEALSKKVSEELSEKVPEILNGHPEIFTQVISPVLMYVFDQLVNNHAGVGIVRRIVKMCILDVINPPHF